MNISLSTTALASALRSLDKIAPTKAVVPILSYVLIDAHADHAWLSCTDNDLSLTRHCATSTKLKGRAALPCKPLLDIISQITEPDVHLVVEKQTVRIAAGQFKLRLQTLDAQYFPTLSAASGQSLLIQGATLRSLLQKIRPSISASEKRYNINGALLVLNAQTLALVATDGKRLAVATAPQPGDAQTYQVILPTKLIDTLIQDDSDDYAFSHNDNQIFFATDHSVLTSKMIDGQFPSYLRIIPTTNTFIIHVDRQLLNAALKRVVLVSGETKAIHFSASADVLQLRAESSELGDAVEHVAIDYAGAETSVKLLAPAIIDFLDVAQNPTIKLSLGGPKAAVLLEDGSDYLTVTMALR